MLSSTLTEFVQSGLSTIIGSTDAHGRPQCMRGMGLWVHDEGRGGRVFLPCAAAGRCVENLTRTRRIAVSMSQLGTHRAVQLKGAVWALALADERDRLDMEQLFERLIERLAYVGFPRAVILNVNRWPCWRVDFEIEDVFVQTPGPDAGRRLEGDLAWT